MRIVWHKQTKTFLNRTFVGVIRTAETQNCRNWYTSLKVIKRLDIWDDAQRALETIVSTPKDVDANVPVVEKFEVEGKELAVVYGVISKGETARGRIAGEYRFVLCDAGEVLTVLSEAFRFKERLGA